jgi:hypothetical protein
VQFRIIPRRLTIAPDTGFEIAIANRVSTPRRATASERFQRASFKNVIGATKASAAGEGPVNS